MMIYDAITVGQLRAALADLDPNDLIYTAHENYDNGGTRVEYLREVDGAIGEIELRFGNTSQDRYVSIDDTVTEMELQDARAALEATNELAPVTELRQHYRQMTRNQPPRHSL